MPADLALVDSKGVNHHENKDSAAHKSGKHTLESSTGKMARPRLTKTPGHKNRRGQHPVLQYHHQQENLRRRDGIMNEQRNASEVRQESRSSSSSSSSNRRVSEEGSTNGEKIEVR